jgi:hypothetical protein
MTRPTFRRSVLLGGIASLPAALVMTNGEPSVDGVMETTGWTLGALLAARAQRPGGDPGLRVLH